MPAYKSSRGLNGLSRALPLPVHLKRFSRSPRRCRLQKFACHRSPLRHFRRSVVQVSLLVLVVLERF